VSEEGEYGVCGIESIVWLDRLTDDVMVEEAIDRGCERAMPVVVGGLRRM